MNKQFAIDLIAAVPPKPEKARIVWCDGGGGPTGHPKVYINLVSYVVQHTVNFMWNNINSKSQPESVNHIQGDSHPIYMPIKNRLTVEDQSVPIALKLD